MTFNCSDITQVHSYRKELDRRLKEFQKGILRQEYSNLQKYSPVRTGFLKNSYQINFQQKNITNNCGYINYVNDGTSKQAGQHFIQISHRITLAKLEQIMNKIQKK